MESIVKQRLLKIIKYKGESLNSISEKIGIQQNTLSRQLNGDTSLSGKTILSIIGYFGDVNADWLFTGEGEMLRDNTTTDRVVGYQPQKSVHAIKYFPNVDGSMGGISFIDNLNETSMDIVIPGYSDCQFAINAYGDSMSPLIKSGQVVLLSQWTERFFDWGKIYLIVTKSGYRTIKRLYPTEGNLDSITCKSENESQNPSFEIEKAEIVKCFIVKGWICRDVI